MMGYKLVKYCRHCKQRFVVEKSRARDNYCKACLTIVSTR